MKKQQNRISLVHFIWTNKKVISAVTFFMLLYAAFENAIPYSMALIIDYGLKNKSLAVINVVFITLLVLGIVITLSQVFRDYLYIEICLGHYFLVHYLKDPVYQQQYYSR